MTESKHEPSRKGHPMQWQRIQRNALSQYAHVLDAIFQAELTGVIVENALPEEMIDQAVRCLASDEEAPAWGSPNQGMPGGELRTIGAAATPTFTARRGPDRDTYAASAEAHGAWTRTIFDGGDATGEIQTVLSGLYHGRPSGPPAFDDEIDWLPYNYRALDPGVQIYSHHDNHYGLSIYEQLDAGYDRSTLLSWFITLQAPSSGGELVVYGLWGSDPNPPMLPTRFLDTAALERDFLKETVSLKAGDLVVFDSGRHVHRVTPVEGDAPRLTLGGFLTAATDQSRLVFWS